MIVAIDITTAPAGEVNAATLGLVAALGRPASPARQRVVLCREEHRRTLTHATHGLATVLTLDPPGTARRDVYEYRRRKLDLLAAHAAALLHVAGGGPLDVMTLGLPVVLSVDGLAHRDAPGRFTPAERGHWETWWTAAAFRADAVIAADESARQALGKQLGLDPDKVFVCPPAADRLPATLAAAYAHAAHAQPLRKAA